jgi:hypothetical protein
VENLITERQAVKLPTCAPASREARKAELAHSLRKAADMNPDEFWPWWFSLPKSERRDLLDVVALEKGCAV